MNNGYTAGNTDLILKISLLNQELEVVDGSSILHKYQVSTAKNGPGEQNGSECTPRGLHCIKLKIGDNCPINSVFVARKPTGEIFSTALAESAPERDWVLSRILWLQGCEPGINSGVGCDSLKRFIYIHGTPDSEIMGEPYSHGCIRMKNKDIIELFNLSYNGMPVHINA